MYFQYLITSPPLSIPVSALVVGAQRREDMLQQEELFAVPIDGEQRYLFSTLTYLILLFILG